VRGGLDGTSIVVIGAGETAARLLSHPAALAGARVTIVNRTHGHATALAAAHHAGARPWDELADALASADVVIGCTASPTPVLDAATLARVRDGADARPVLCLDLGVPRDIDPGVAALPGVTLIDVDRLEAEAAARRAERTDDLVRAEAIVAQETERYMEWWRGRGVVSTVRRLHATADAIRDAELERAYARLPELTPRARGVIREMATRMVGKLLHEPTVALKRDPEGANMAMVVERLFALSEVADVVTAAVATTEHCARDDALVQPRIHQESVAT
jgi:glutamyl-tRNA reductase